MATRSDRLNRLTTGFTCKASWDEMAGEGFRRHCAECCRDVLDFAQMMPREIEAHLAASRGQLCGRLTRRGDRLVMAPALERLRPAKPRERRRAPAVAATLVSAWLAASAGSARAGEPPPAEPIVDRDAADRTPAPRQADVATPGAALRGVVHDDGGSDLPGATVVVNNTLAGTTYEAVTLADGSFAFDGLPLGTYKLETTLEGFAIAGSDQITLRDGGRVDVEVTLVPSSEGVTMGVVVPAAQPLRSLFDESELVVVGVAGPSFVVDGDDDFASVATELRVETVVKGPAELRRISYRHQEYTDGSSGGILAGELVPGTRVLAFLKRHGDEELDRRAPAYEAVGYESVKLLSEAEIDAYVGRLEALQRIEVRAARRGGDHDPEALVDWLVDTIEDRLTRGEATEELAWALEALDERAHSSVHTPAQAASALVDLVDSFRGQGGRMLAEPPPAVVGAFLTRDQRERLTGALAATVGLRGADRALFWLVRRWDEPAAMAWLAAQLDGPVADDDEEELHYWLQNVVGGTNDVALQAVVDEAAARVKEIDALWSEDQTEEADALREEKLKAVRASLRHDVAAALAGRPRG